MIYLGRISNTNLKKELLDLGINELNGPAGQDDIVITDAKYVMTTDFSDGVRSFLLLNETRKESKPYLLKDIQIASKALKKLTDSTQLNIVFSVHGQVDYTIDIYEVGRVFNRFTFNSLENLYGYNTRVDNNNLFSYEPCDFREFIEFISNEKFKKVTDIVKAYELREENKKEA